MTTNHQDIQQQKEKPATAADQGKEGRSHPYTARRDSTLEPEPRCGSNFLFLCHGQAAHTNEEQHYYQGVWYLTSSKQKCQNVSYHHHHQLHTPFHFRRHPARQNITPLVTPDVTHKTFQVFACVSRGMLFRRSWCILPPHPRVIEARTVAAEKK